jgi:hypothetical protein
VGTVTPRLLVVMGSGETTPTMVKVHRMVVDAVGAEPPGLVLDTPFGFQLNADDLAARTVAYFEASVGVPVEVANARAPADLTGRAGDTLAARLTAAPFVFSGPGSPTYALRLWRGTVVPGLLADKLATGGAVVFSSAAALTLGAFTVPVYEVYKVGEPPRWETGLDLLRGIDPRLHAAVVPHYDNAEGGNHDTRFCYLGEPRLAQLLHELPDDAFVLGIDEHTAVSFDLDGRTATVAGRGALSLRVGARTATVAAGATVTVDELLDTVADLRRPSRDPAASASVSGSGVPDRPSTDPDRSQPTDPDRSQPTDPALSRPTDGEDDTATNTASRPPTPDSAPGAPPVGSPLIDATRRLQGAFGAARQSQDAPAMVDAVLALEDELWAWRTDPSQTDEQDRVRAVLRGLVDQLGQVAAVGTRDPATVVGPFVDLALALRAEARSQGRYADADHVRDALTALGVEIRDTPTGTTWLLTTSAER